LKRSPLDEIARLLLFDKAGQSSRSHARIDSKPLPFQVKLVSTRFLSIFFLSRCVCSIHPPRSRILCSDCTSIMRMFLHRPCRLATRSFPEPPSSLTSFCVFLCRHVQLRASRLSFRHSDSTLRPLFFFLIYYLPTLL